MVAVNSFGFFALIVSLVVLHPKCRKKMKTRQIDTCRTKVALIDQNGLTKEDRGVGRKVSSDKNTVHTQVMPVAAINQENERSARAQKAWSSEE